MSKLMSTGPDLSRRGTSHTLLQWLKQITGRLLCQHAANTLPQHLSNAIQQDPPTARGSYIGFMALLDTSWPPECGFHSSTLARGVRRSGRSQLGWKKATRKIIFILHSDHSALQSHFCNIGILWSQRQDLHDTCRGNHLLPTSVQVHMLTKTYPYLVVRRSFLFAMHCVHIACPLSCRQDLSSAACLR